MRALHGALASAVVLALTGVAAPAQAAGPTAPYTALYVDGSTGSWWHQGSLAYDATNGSTFTVGATGTDQVDFRADRGTDNWVIHVAPPTGSTWTAGTDYELSLVPDAAKAYIDVAHAGATCDEAPGTLHVEDVVRGSGGALTGFAATFVLSCFSNYQDLHGEIRWNSGTAYAGAGTDLMAYDFGSRLVGSGPVSKTFTVTSLGAGPVVFGDPTFIENSGSYAISQNSCTGASLAYGETCTITVTAHSTKLSGDWTLLKLADNTSLGARWFQLGMNGVDPRTVTVSPGFLSFDGQILYELGAPQRVTVTGTGDTPDTFTPATITGTDAANFFVTTDTCKGVSLAKNQTCYVEVAAKPLSTAYPKYATLELHDNSLTPTKSVQLTLYYVTQGFRGTYSPVTPARILDTRSGLGAPKSIVHSGNVVHLQVLGQGGLPFNGVSAVVLNLTVTGPIGSGFLTAYPSDVARPTASSLNYVKGGLRSNSVTVPVGADGAVNIYASTATHIVADVNGWYAGSAYYQSGQLAGQLQPVEPYRLFDSRSDWGEPLPAGYYAQLADDYGTANSHIRAFVVNITAVSPRAAGFLTAWDGNGTNPSTSTVNYTKGGVTPNFAIVPVGPCTICTGKYYGLPSISIFSPQTTHVVVDVVGLIDDGTLPDGLRFTPQTPQRIVDSRSALGLTGPLGGASTATVTAPGSVLPAATQALMLNATGIQPTANTYMSLWPTGLARPTVSTLNLGKGEIAANASLTLLGGSGINQFDIYNNSGTAHAVVDVVGAFWLYPGTASPSFGQGVLGGAAGPRRAAPGVVGLGTPAPLPHKA
ncbi:choice-of-anchor D domain-containing protein [Hamadaea tsunoensis]|uniref:choice-of-anchor D domain-containing protein n=1 Tax=Hamadaea tsunoensis TaxID=53368 RepID=UPI0004283C0B|nr:choice-of-anchor D domain-containing protein [Hamadaea tsunoensis]